MKRFEYVKKIIKTIVIEHVFFIFFILYKRYFYFSLIDFGSAVANFAHFPSTKFSQFSTILLPSNLFRRLLLSVPEIIICFIRVKKKCLCPGGRTSAESEFRNSWDRSSGRLFSHRALMRPSQNILSPALAMNASAVRAARQRISLSIFGTARAPTVFINFVSVWLVSVYRVGGALVIGTLEIERLCSKLVNCFTSETWKRWIVFFFCVYLPADSPWCSGPFGSTSGTCMCSVGSSLPPVFGRRQCSSRQTAHSIHLQRKVNLKINILTIDKLQFL